MSHQSGCDYWNLGSCDCDQNRYCLPRQVLVPIDCAGCRWTEDRYFPCLKHAAEIRDVTFGPRIPAVENSLHKFEIPDVSGPQG